MAPKHAGRPAFGGAPAAGGAKKQLVDDSKDDDFGFTINENFARKYEDRKKLEEMSQRTPPRGPC